MFNSVYNLVVRSKVFLVAMVLAAVSTATLCAANNIFRPIYLSEPALFNECLNIEKGDDGFMWIANSEGVIRYDGYSVKKYYCEYNFLRTLHKLTDGTIIMLNNFSEPAINRYDAIRDEFVELPIDGIDPSAITECGAVDDQNNLWIGTSHGIVCYNGTSGQWHSFTDFATSEIKSIVVVGKKIAFFDGANSFFLVTPDLDNGELAVVNSVESPFGSVPKSALYDPYLRSIHYGFIDIGLYSYDLASGEFSKHTTLNLDNITIKTIEHLDPKHILIGTDGLGVMKVDREQFSLEQHYQYNDPHNYSILSNAIYDLYVDTQERIYAATYAHGVQVLDAAALDYELLVPRGNHGEPLHSTVNALYEHSDGSLWMGTNEGICTVSKGGTRHNLYRFDHSIPSSNKVVLTIRNYAGKVYAGGYGGGLLSVDCAKGVLRPHAAGDGVENSNFMFALYNDNNSKMWMGGIDSKLMSYDAKSGEFRSYGDNIGVTSIEAYSATQLIYSADYRLFIIDKISQQVSSFAFEDSLLEELGVSEVKTHTIRRHNNTLYFATNNCGLIGYNTDSNVVTSYATMLNKDYSNILSLEIDLRGDIWMATSNGIAHLNMQEGEVKCYKHLGVVEAGSFIKGASLLTRDGRVMFGTLHGALVINPNSYHESRINTSKPFLTDFKISYNSILDDPSQLELEQPLCDIERLRLSYEQNTFSLYFTQIYFSRFEPPLYSWLLDGVDNQWSPISTASFAEYRNIAPGLYTFRIRAYQSQNSEDYIERNIEIRVLNPWYWRWYMNIIYLLLFVSAVVLVLRLYNHRVERRHVQERIDSYINVLHSLLTPITLTKAPLESLGREISDSSTASHLLSVVSRNIDRLHSIVSSQTDFKSIISEVSDRQELSLNDYFRDLSDSFWEYALFNNVRLNLEVKQPNRVIYISREALDKIMDNLLSNAIKYSDKDGVVDVVITYNVTHWSVQVNNGGNWIPSSQQRRLFKEAYRADNGVNRLQPGSGMGLLLTSKLVRAMGGVISFESNAARGTSFTVRFELSEVKNSTLPNEIIDDAALESVSDIRTTLPIGDIDTIGDEAIPPLDEQVQLSDADHQFIERVNEIIRANLANQDFSIDSLCGELFMSRSAFYNKMKHITNLTPNEMLRRARMEAALDLLRKGEHSVQEISDMVGFSDAKYFSKVFYKSYGYYPSKFSTSATH